MLRRILFVGLVIFLADYIGLQIMCVIGMNTFVTAYLASEQPFEDKHSMRMELFNEVTISLVSLLLSLFTNYVTYTDIQYLFGWLAITVICMNIIVNISFTLLNSIKSGFNSLRLKIMKWRSKSKPESNQDVLELEEKQGKYVDESSFKRTKQPPIAKKTIKMIPTLPAVMESDEESAPSEDNFNVFSAMERNHVPNKLNESEESECFGKDIMIQE